ncbi:immunoglobulin superfamily member 6-like [Acipenser oxyrinchus oxyrinchus]|nr:immunoglobulin superfamily member 6-like [Acipenser oxyrinchus oxyrinchus]
MHSFMRIVLCACLITPSGHAFTPVQQTPSSVTVQAGKGVTLTCSFNGTGLEIKVRWFRYSADNTSLQIEISLQHNVCSEFINRTAVKENNCTSILSLNALLPNDSGVYVCEVQRWIPGPHAKEQGNGTLVNVTHKHPADIIYYIAGVLIIIALGLGIVALVYFKIRVNNSSVSRVGAIDAHSTPEDTVCSRPDTHEVCYASLNFNKKRRDPSTTGLMHSQYEATESTLQAKAKTPSEGSARMKHPKTQEDTEKRGAEEEREVLYAHVRG